MTYAVTNVNKNRVEELMDKKAGESSDSSDSDEIYDTKRKLE